MRRLAVMLLATMLLAGCGALGGGLDPGQIALSRDALVLTYADMRVAHQSLRLLLTGACQDGRLGPKECGELRVWDAWATGLLDRTRAALEAPVVQPEQVQRQFRELLEVMSTMAKLMAK